MEMWTEVRRPVLPREITKRAACREYGLHWTTLRKILEHVEPPTIAARSRVRTRSSVYRRLMRFRRPIAARRRSSVIRPRESSIGCGMSAVTSAACRW